MNYLAHKDFLSYFYELVPILLIKLKNESISFLVEIVKKKKKKKHLYLYFFCC